MSKTNPNERATKTERKTSPARKGKLSQAQSVKVLLYGGSSQRGNSSPKARTRRYAHPLNLREVALPHMSFDSASISPSYSGFSQLWSLDAALDIEVELPTLSVSAAEAKANELTDQLLATRARIDDEFASEFDDDFDEASYRAEIFDRMMAMVADTHVIVRDA